MEKTKLVMRVFLLLFICLYSASADAKSQNLTNPPDFECDVEDDCAVEAQVMMLVQRQMQSVD
ncbi:MAG: hypothetical protein ACI85O_000854 [Saprospiraceae bacterium]|jgi:hypothetical protein